MDKICGIYKITSPSGKIYIGQSSDIKRRFYCYSVINNCENQIRLKRSLLKYKPENHIFEIIEECSVNLLSERERYWQEHYNSVEHGLNCIYVKTEEKPAIFNSDSKLKMRNAHLGKKLSAVHKENMSKAKIGKVLCQETKDKISKALLGKTKNLSEKGLKNLVSSIQKRQNKKISCKNPSGNIVVFNSFKDAAKTIGVSPQAIQNVVHKIKSKTGKCQNWSDFKIVESKSE